MQEWKTARRRGRFAWIRENVLCEKANLAFRCAHSHLNYLPIILSPMFSKACWALCQHVESKSGHSLVCIHRTSILDITTRCKKGAKGRGTQINLTGTCAKRQQSQKEFDIRILDLKLHTAAQRSGLDVWVWQQCFKMRALVGEKALSVITGHLQ